MNWRRIIKPVACYLTTVLYGLFICMKITKPVVYDSGLKQKVSLEDVFISVKTTRYNQDTRLPIILNTWFQLARNQTWFFTDIYDEEHQEETNGHIINTKCMPKHKRLDLCCKLSAELDHFLANRKTWFCHFDDDNYVNVVALIRMLQRYDPQKDWYLGKPSLRDPINIYSDTLSTVILTSFWFGTGGAGFCISRHLALKMIPVAGSKRFYRKCQTTSHNDDVLMGYIVHLMEANLTVIPEFHSHYELMDRLDIATFRHQISFSYYINKTSGEWNVVSVPGFNTTYDPTRFLSLHCFLYPYVEFCL